MTIKTLNQLADYINSQDDYPLDVDDICQENGWIVCTDDWSIAIDKVANEKLSFTGEGDKVDVSPYRGGAREGAGRPTLCAEKKRVQLYLSEDNIARVGEYASGKALSRSDAVNSILDDFFLKSCDL